MKWIFVDGPLSLWERTVPRPLSLWERVRVRASARTIAASRAYTSPLPKGEGRRPNRRAAVMIIILVCFIVAAAMFVMLGRQAVAERRASETQLWTAQAQWIAEAAVERAAARLVADAKYTGETWAIPAAEMDGKQSGKASIHVENVAARPDSRLVRVEADYPDDPVHRARWTKEIIIDLKKPTTSQAAKKP